jgi:hypothetical protein
VTYAFSLPLQEAIHARLTQDPVIAGLVAGRIHDDPPHTATRTGEGLPYIVLGDEEVDAWSTATDRGALHAVQISIVSGQRGFAGLKRIAQAVCDAMLGPLDLTRGRVVNATFLAGRTRRIGKDALRRLDLRFRLAIEDDVSAT